MIDLVHRSTASRCLASRPLSLPPTFASSAARMASALACSLPMTGTKSSVRCHAMKPSSSDASNASASSTERRLLAWFFATTAFRSSTLYALTPASSLHCSSTLRGTEMSTSISRRSAGITASSPSLVTMQCVAPVDVKTASHVRSASSSASMPSHETATSGNCAASSCERSSPRLSRRTAVIPLDARCVSSSRDMVPAPTMQIDAPSKGRPSASSLRISASSAAADEIETAPFAIDVSERTRLPAATATLSSLLSTLPAEPSDDVACPKHAFT
mmetsp:Transcript_13620/g.42631  ORF Transcript_13620/g.42631 Transcript_13620/m.42631 type:complete len:274 (+) Transcript_13620:1003-1824(+)